MSNISPLFAVEAEELLNSGRAQEAIDLCKQGIEAFPNYTIAYGILARAHSAIGDSAVAESVLESAAQSFPRSKTIRKIVDLSHSGDINQILHEFEAKLEKENQAKKQTKKKKSQSKKFEKSEEVAKESDVINELIADIAYDRIEKKVYQETIYTQAEVSDLKLIFTSDKIDAYVLPFKANFIDKKKREAHFSHDNFMFPPLFFDIKFNPEKIESPTFTNSLGVIDDVEREMFFDDAIATFNTSLSMNNESEELEELEELKAKQEQNTESIETESIEIENVDSSTLDNIQQVEELVDSKFYGDDLEEVIEELEDESNKHEINLAELVTDIESNINDLPENELESSEEATSNLLNEISELDIFEQIESPILKENESENSTFESRLPEEIDIMSLIEESDKSIAEYAKSFAVNQNENFVEELEEEVQLPVEEEVQLPVEEEVQLPVEELEANYEIDTDDESEEIGDIVGDIIGKIITDNTPRNLSIEQIGNQLNNFGVEEVEEEDEENYSDFASETIAEIFAEQGAYTNSIKMYTKLIDQEPEKAEYYLAKIEEIKILKNQ